MNNRYLYKAKRLNNGEWVEGYYYRMSETTYAFEEDHEQNPVPTHHYILFERMTDWGLPNQMMQVEVDLSTLCQCTGLTDKHGKLIWENSKCSVERPCIYAVGHIKYLSGCFCFVEDGTRHILRLCDIKPNGYEIKVESGNPELLEVE